MRRVVLTPALACGLALLWVAAPALSLRPYRPEPVDFSLAAPRSDGLVSEPLEAPKRFNLVGLTWTGGAREPQLEVRTRRDGGGWSRWTPLSAEPDHAPDPGREAAGRRASSPTWAGEADWVQYRADERLAGVRLRFVNVRGTATAAGRARTALRRAVGVAVTTLAGIARTPAARAGGPQPPIVSRAGWGAGDCPPRAAPELGEVKAAFVHHTVNANDYTRAEAPAVVLAICRYHRNTNGWNDIGYNFLVDRFGVIYEGRAGGIDQPVVGAQAQGYNAQTTGIANLGTFTSVAQTPGALRAMAALIRWKLPLEGSPTAGTATLVSAGGSSNRFPAGQNVTVPRVLGHRDTGSTSCPGNALYAQLPELRRLVGDVQPGGTATRIRARVMARRATVRVGSAAGVAGTLTVGGAPPLARLPVEVQAFIGSTWRTVAQPTTDLLGRFSATVRPQRTRSLRVRFAGLATLRRSTSPRFSVAVRPIVTLSRLPTRAATGAAVAYRGRVRPRKRYVFQVLQHRRGGRFRKVGVKRLRVRRDGSFRGSFVPARAGAYRFYVVAKLDRVSVRGASPRHRVRASRSRGGGAAASRAR